MFVIPNTKQIASKILDLPEPLRPVIALKDESHPVIWVRTGYDLNPASRKVSHYPFKGEYIEEHTLQHQLFNPHFVASASWMMAQVQVASVAARVVFVSVNSDIDCRTPDSLGVYQRP